MNAHKRSLKSETLITLNKYENKREDAEIIVNTYNPNHGFEIIK